MTRFLKSTSARWTPHGRSSHPCFNQGVDDGPVAVRAVALATGALRGDAVAVAVTGAPTGLGQQIGGVEETPALGGRDRPLDV